MGNELYIYKKSNDENSKVMISLRGTFVKKLKTEVIDENESYSDSIEEMLSDEEKI